LVGDIDKVPIWYAFSAFQTEDYKPKAKEEMDRIDVMKFMIEVMGSDVNYCPKGKIG
jgi:hypothetical protein